ncbi:hypothetical protein AMQ84_27000 [Paenibacillus riograndensis]|uniref:Uncharacterized protein n=2 Tax=Paenibacillus riograndensis TaxID=483937 RepID=A0A132TJR9_9BACL|nr:hypothetical protein AMQ84_27000 [Paenibacillus riograndensis]
MQAKNQYPQPIEYYVVTTCCRNFVWSALDYDSLLLSLHFRGYTPTFIMPYEEYLAEMELADEYLKREEERELKEPA